MCCRVFYAYKVKRYNLQCLHKERCKIATVYAHYLNNKCTTKFNKQIVTNKRNRLVHMLIVTVTELTTHIYNFKPAHFIH